MWELTVDKLFIYSVEQSEQGSGDAKRDWTVFSDGAEKITEHYAACLSWVCISLEGVSFRVLYKENKDQVIHILQFQHSSGYFQYNQIQGKYIFLAVANTCHIKDCLRTRDYVCIWQYLICMQ